MNDKLDKANKGGRPKIELTEQQKNQISFYAKNGLPMEAIAQLIGVSERTLWRRIREDPEVLALYKKGVYLANSAVANWLFDSCKPTYKRQPKIDSEGNPVINDAGMVVMEDVKVSDGNTAAQIFWLKSRAGWREKISLEIEKLPTVDEIPPEFERLSDEDRRRLIEIYEKLEDAEIVDGEESPD